MQLLFIIVVDNFVTLMTSHYQTIFSSSQKNESRVFIYFIQFPICQQKNLLISHTKCLLNIIVKILFSFALMKKSNNLPYKRQ